MRVPNPAAGTIAAIRLIEGLTVYPKKSSASEKTLVANGAVRRAQASASNRNKSIGLSRLTTSTLAAWFALFKGYVRSNPDQ
jgi:hypothetical protein